MQIAQRIFRLSWWIWFGGTALAVLSWINVLHPHMATLGLLIVVFGSLLQIVAWAIYRFSRALDPADLTHPLAAFLPDATLIPPELQLVFQRTASNMDVANEHKDSKAKLSELDANGRIISVVRNYMDKRRKRRDLTWVQANIQIIAYQSQQAVQKMINLDEIQRPQHYLHSKQRKNELQLGNFNRTHSFLVMNVGYSPQPLTSYEIEFCYADLLIIVSVFAVQGTKQPAEVYDLALNLAQQIEHKLKTAEYRSFSVLN